MSYSIEVMQRAQQRLEWAKADRKSRQQENLQKAYTAVPRIKEIDLELRRSMAIAAQMAFTKGADVREMMEQVKNANLALQKERETLVNAHFEEGFLDESPVCGKCQGVGYVGSAMCSCLHELCKQEQNKELSYLLADEAEFDKFRLDLYPDRNDQNLGVNIRAYMEKIFSYCKQYAKNFSLKAENLLFSGTTGQGKTFLSACIARVVSDGGFSVTYESASHLFAKLEKAKFSADPEALKQSERFVECDLLILDDLGTEMTGQFMNAAFYTLINDRMQLGRPTIISTNLTNEELEKRYNYQTVSRLRGCYRRLAFLGDDIRVLKNRRL